MAHLLTDEAFALSIAHFRRLGRTDEWATGSVRSSRRSSPGTSRRWPEFSSAAKTPDPARFGIDIIFPAAMIGLAVGLITGRRELVAAMVGAAIGVLVALATSPAIGIIAVAWWGPVVGLLVPEGMARETAPLGSLSSADRFVMPGAHVTPPPETDDAGAER